MWVDLDIPVPANVAALCGYPGEARYVGLCWQPCGDEVEYDDGRTAGTGNWAAYLAFTQHLAVGPLLAAYDLGSSDGEPEHILIVDQAERKAFVADQRTGREFLRRQPHPPLPEFDASATADSLADFLDVSKWREVAIDQAAVKAHACRGSRGRTDGVPPRRLPPPEERRP
jgi:hypothetical protein